MAKQTDITPTESQSDISLSGAGGDEFQLTHGEPLSRTLDLSTWQAGADLMELYQRLEQEVSEAVQQEQEFQKQIRQEIFPKIAQRVSAPDSAGVYQATPEQLAEVHRKILFNGGVEACDGTVVTHDTLPVTITQIGVCLVAYNGNQGSWVHRLYRRDLRTRTKQSVDEIWELLNRRAERSALEVDDPADQLSSLARRGIMAYAERAVLLEHSEAVWRMGHGSPTPYELITGSGMRELLEKSLDLLARLINHKKFIYVPSATKARELLTIGNALRPLEYAIIDDNKANLEKIQSGHYRGQEWGDLGKRVRDFTEEFGSQIVVGMFRASEMAPCQMFYAHADYAHQAALIAMSDSLLQEHRGFPMLIDLADTLCATTFGADTFAASTQMAYAEAGQPYRYQAERRTRQR